MSSSIIFFSSPIHLDHLLDQQTYAYWTVQCMLRDHAPRTNFASQEKLSYAKEEAFFLQNGTTKGMWRFCQRMFRQMSCLKLSNEYKMGKMSKSKSRMSLTFTRKIWVALIEQINFDLPIQLVGGREYGIGTSFGLCSMLLLATHIF